MTIQQNNIPVMTHRRSLNSTLSKLPGIICGKSKQNNIKDAIRCHCNSAKMNHSFIFKGLIISFLDGT
jgi:hypothetical protein